MNNIVFVAILRLTFCRSCFFDDNVYSKGEVEIVTKKFYGSSFDLAYSSLKTYLDYESDEGILKDCDVSILSFSRVI